MYLVVLLVFVGLMMHFLDPHDVLDIRFFYTSSQANNYLRGLNDFKARSYLFKETLDLLFFTTYSLLFFLLARRFYFRKAWLALLPGLFDLIETTTIIFLLINRTQESPVWLGYATCLKWTSGFVVGAAIVAGFIKRLKLAST